MQPFKILKSTYVVIPANDIDTDQIIPARFLKGTDKAGLGDNLFYDWRYDENGNPRPDFILNQPRAKKSKILVAGDNFGCGSSREHAPWALVGYGFRAVISTSFADIFRNNAMKNSLLPVQVDEKSLQQLMRLAQEDEDAKIVIDLTEQTLSMPDGNKTTFPIDTFSKTCLLEGIDQLGYLQKHLPEIEEYEKTHPPRIDTLAGR